MFSSSMISSLYNKLNLKPINPFYFNEYYKLFYVFLQGHTAICTQKNTRFLTSVFDYFYIFPSLEKAYIMPPIPPIWPPIGIAGTSSLMSTIPASVVNSIADADAAF